MTFLRPIGNGAGSFAAMFPAVEFAHNDPLQLYFEYGVPGLLVAFFVLAQVTQAGPRAPRAALCVIFVEGLFSMPFQLPASGFLAALLAGHLYGYRARLRAKQSLCGMGAAACA